VKGNTAAEAVANGCVSCKHSSQRLSLTWTYRDVIANSCSCRVDCVTFCPMTAFLLEVHMRFYRSPQLWRKKNVRPTLQSESFLLSEVQAPMQ
jgi:hypothetical protein